MMSPRQVMTVLERYFEGVSMGGALQSAGLGRCDGYNTGGLKGSALARAEIGAALCQLTRRQAQALARYYQTWQEIEVKRSGEGATLDPRDDHQLKILGREPHARAALMIMGRELHNRLRS